MVTVRTRHADAEPVDVDLDRWLDDISSQVMIDAPARLLQACEMVQAAERHAHKRPRPSFRRSPLLTGLEMAEILADLHLDQRAIEAAVLYRAVREDLLDLDAVRKEFGNEVADLIQGVLRMMAISQSRLADPAIGSTRSQVDNVRRMLVSMIDDVRVALIKLAERTCAIRAVKDADEARRVRVAREVFDIYAPLAHRLGVGHIKWELEDLSFRYLQPEQYQRIAQLLDEKRLDRERYIREVLDTLRETLGRMDIDATLSGRAKHIFSIWRKMKRKGLDFSSIYDVRAIRILVPEIRDCYATLGVVHSLWNHIPSEFDDYIAKPKENGYRSLHTAVVGPDGRTMEVQIRTHAMHDEAELGVCAHHLYKEGAGATGGEDYERKIAWLRQLMEWQDELGDVAGLVDELRGGVEDRRIYVFTPEGHVVDLPAGATPVDFAYHIHTEIGHQCRGARINDRMQPLNTTLNTGDRVEILKGRVGGPSRDWLNPNLGFVHNARTRNKIQQWFRAQDRDENLLAGRKRLESEFDRMGLPLQGLETVAGKLNYRSIDDLYVGIGAGDVRVSQVLAALPDALRKKERESLERNLRPASRPAASSDQLLIRGVGKLLTQRAGCCTPLPGDAIRGYITQGRGVSVHRQDCPNLLQLAEDDPDRIVDVEWSGETRQFYTVTLQVLAFDRSGLLRDVTAVLAGDHVNLSAANTHTDPDSGEVSMQLTLEVSGLERLGRIIDRLRQLPNVTSVTRLRN